MRATRFAIVATLVIATGCGGGGSGNDTSLATDGQTLPDNGEEEVDGLSGGDGDGANQPDNVVDGPSDSSTCEVATRLIPDSQRSLVGKAANLTFGPQNTLYFTDERFRSLWQYTVDSGASQLHSDAHDYRNILGVTSESIYLTGRQFDGEPYGLYELSLADNSWRSLPGTEGANVLFNAGTVVGGTVFFFVKSVLAVELWTYSPGDGVRIVSTGEQLSGKLTVLDDAVLFSQRYVSGYETATMRNFRYDLSSGSVEQMDQLAIGDRYELRVHGDGLSYARSNSYVVMDASGQELTSVPFTARHSSYQPDGDFIYTYQASNVEGIRDGVYQLMRLDASVESAILATSMTRFGNFTLLDTGLYGVFNATDGATLFRYASDTGLTTLTSFRSIDPKTDRQMDDPLFNADGRLYFTAEGDGGWSLWSVDTACNDLAAIDDSNT